MQQVEISPIVLQEDDLTLEIFSVLATHNLSIDSRGVQSMDTSSTSSASESSKLIQSWRTSEPNEVVADVRIAAELSFSASSNIGQSFCDITEKTCVHSTELVFLPTMNDSINFIP